MKEGLPQPFLTNSREIMKDIPEIKQKLKIIMGQVADDLVTDKYVEPNKSESLKEKNDPPA